MTAPDLHSEMLRTHGLHVTAQRLAVLDAVTEHQHTTADEVVTRARATLGAISRQAVYDTLGTLADKGIIRRIQPSGFPALYENRIGDNHHHLVCRECGTVVDVDCAVHYTPCLTASDDHGFAIDEAEVIYWGHCASCSRSS
jgi:Fur family ferric uptake transcriptional regulator